MTQDEPIPSAIRAHVSRRLDDASTQHGVAVLFACESGSRAWGFPSDDSDYDVRFLYRHPTAWYVSLAELRDVIEAPLDAELVDLAGWDLRKALRLLLKSNPALAEWLASPIIYRQVPDLRDELTALFAAFADRRAIAFHYRSMMHHQCKVIFADPETVRRKKYLYAMRSACALGWSMTHADLPPMAVDDLLAGVELPADVRTAFEGLIAEKRSIGELGEGVRIAPLDRYLEALLTSANPSSLPSRAALEHREASAAADAFYRRWIGFAPA